MEELAVARHIEIGVEVMDEEMSGSVVRFAMSVLNFPC